MVFEGTPSGRVIERGWFESDAPDLAPELLGKVLVSRIEGRRVAGRIIEVEAYTQDDPASHTFAGPTARNEVMFGPPGHLYVYLSYGIHHCVNVVAGRDGDGQAVLIRAVEPLEGLDCIRRRRSGRRDAELANGPGKVGASFAIDLRHNAVDVCAQSSVVHLLDIGEPVDSVITSARVGISKAIDVQWRFRLAQRTP